MRELIAHSRAPSMNRFALQSYFFHYIDKKQGGEGDGRCGYAGSGAADEAGALPFHCKYHT